jgi:hypothetical protein
MLRVIHPNRWFFWTISIILAIGLFLLFSISKTVNDLDEQASAMTAPGSVLWKTYHSKTLGVSVVYPGSWQIETDPEIAQTVSLQNPNNNSENISIFVLDPKFEKIIRSSLLISSEKPVVVDGYSGAWLIGKNPNDPATSNIVLVPVGSKLYYIAGQARKFERILSSVKF